jgi:hypothetical protein
VLLQRLERQRQQVLPQRQAQLPALREEQAQAEALVLVHRLLEADRPRKQLRRWGEVRPLQLRQQQGIHAQLRGAELVQHQVLAAQAPKVHRQSERVDYKSDARSQHHRQVITLRPARALKASDLKATEVIHGSRKMRRANLVANPSNLALANLRQVQETPAHITARKQKNTKAVVRPSNLKAEN